jgi:DNA polymerase III subunit delta
LTVDSIIKELKEKKFRPIYVFHGEENYFIDKLVDYIEHNVIPIEAQAFNQFVVYGKDVDHKYIADEARQYPLMSDKRLIIVKEAQDMKTLKDLVDYVKRPVPHTIVVLAHKNKALDKRISLYKALDGHVLFESKKLYDNQLPQFIKDYASKIQLKIDDQIAHVISEYLGNDLAKIANELDKLLINLGKSSAVTLAQVQDLIGISKEFSVFELQKALGERSKTKSYLIAKHMGENGKDNPIQMVVANLFTYFVKLMIITQHQKEADPVLQKKIGLTSAFFLKDYKSAARNYTTAKLREVIGVIRTTDLASKGVNNKSSDDAALLQELVYKILA